MLPNKINTAVAVNFVSLFALTDGSKTNDSIHERCKSLFEILSGALFHLSLVIDIFIRWPYSLSPISVSLDSSTVDDIIQ